MNLKILTLTQAFNKAYLRIKPKRLEFDNFKESLSKFLNSINESESEEHNKIHIRDFLKSTFYGDNEINTKARNDLVIYLGKNTNSKAGILIEAKHPNNKNEIVQKNNLNAKAMHEVILYYLRERIEEKNDEIKQIIITNAYEWYIFDAHLFEKHFYKNNELRKEYETWVQGGKVSSKTEHFYNEIAPKALEAVDKEFEFIHFDLREYKKYLKDQKDEAKLIHLYKIFSTHHLLKEPFASDGYSLDKQFYQELLHIIGLEEIKVGSKKLIDRKAVERREGGSLIENTINKLKTKDITKHLPNPESFGGTEEIQLYNIALELCITWINRILFLKLLEAQLVKYHNGAPSYKFLDIKTIKEYDDLHELFHEVLAIRIKDRYKDILEKFKNIPYLNSSLFEISDLERATIEINGLKDRFKLSICGHTILKENGKTQTEPLSTLHYLLKFLDAYDFSSESSSQEVQEEEKRLISASVLGLIFEKINGYKDGSFFTPGFITMYMCRETLRRAVLQKFKDVKGWQCETIDELKDKIIDRKEANEIINSLKICDPGVGSGHYLVSALNELIAIKSELGILCYRDGSRIKYHKVEIQNDELIITDEENDEIFDYCLSETNKPISEKQKLQEALFHEKETIIENCLFGVDINPNSVSICRLRLWIELLKNAYYTQESNYTELETLPNIDINIKQGNSLISRFELHDKLSSLPPITQQKMKLATEKYKEQVFIYKAMDDKAVKEQTRKRIKELKEEFASIVNPNDKDYIRLKELEAELAQQVLIYDRKEVAEWEKKTENLHKEKEKLEKAYNEKLKTLYGNAFEWRFEFPEVLDEEGNFVGFDVVMGNPPWGDIFNKNEKEYLKNHYMNIDSSTPNAFAYFLGLTIKLNANLNAILLPDSFLVKDFEKTRTLLKSSLIILRWYQNTGLPFELQPFKDVEHDVAMVMYDKSIHPVLECYMYHFNDVLVEELIAKEKEKMIFPEYGNTYNLLVNNLDYNIKVKCQSLDIIDNVMQCHEGIHTGNIREKLFKRTKIRGDEKPLFIGAKNGDMIMNYYAKRSGWYVDYRKEIIIKEKGEYASLRDENIFRYTKIYITRTGDPFKAFIDLESYASNNFFSLQFKDYEQNTFENLAVILCIINSRFAQYFIRKIIAPRIGNTFIETKIIHLLALPVPQISASSKNELVHKVNKIINLKNRNIETDTSKLESEIDQLVYQLYGLTEEEIKIVEGNEHIR